MTAAGPPPAWPVQRHRGPAAELHRLGLPEPAGRLVRLLEVDGPALVLGRSQPLSVVDDAACAAAGVAVVRRASGGGAVLVEPAGLVWVDVVVPAGDRLWVGDLSRSFDWLGRAWALALSDLGCTGARPHAGASLPGRWGARVCFAGLGPGEVVSAAGAKVVGMAQRRRVAGAVFQCAVLRRWEPASTLSLLCMPPSERREAAVALAAAATTVVGAGPEAVVAALLGALAAVAADPPAA